MSAREIIATTAVEGRREPIGHLHATAIISMLTAAGYRILAPGELDRETVESAAKKADAWADDLDLFKDKGPREVMRGYAAAIRSLGRPQP